MKDNDDLFEFTEVKISKIDSSLEETTKEQNSILQEEIEKQEEKIDDIKEEVKEEKYRPTLSDTIMLKLSDIRERMETQEREKQKKSLYNTVIIKLDDIINKNNSLNKKNGIKVTNIESSKKKKNLMPAYKSASSINVDTDDYGKYLYKLNKLAIKNLTKQTKTSNIDVRDEKHSKLVKIDNVHVSKKNYNKYQEELNKFAINKLYYKCAPKESKKYKLYKLCLTFSLVIFIFSSIIIANWLRQGTTIKHLENKIIDNTNITKVKEEGTVVNIDEKVNESLYWKYLNTPLSSVDFTSLLKENSDTVGWLIVNDTNINYPVVQTNNNDYYLNHAYDKSSNNAGWVYADFRDNFNVLNKNVVIYGHGRKDKIMFGSLTKSLDREWYTKEQNQIIQLSTLKYNTMWQVFSIYTKEAESYYITTDFNSSDEFARFLNEMNTRSIYNFGVNLSTDDKILTLSTCYNDNGIRLVVHAKLVKIQER